MSSRVSQALQSNMHHTHGKTCESVDVLKAENVRLKAELVRLKSKFMTLECTADADALLPIYNRRAFMRELDRATTILARHDILSTMIFFDLNGFKAVNDRFGHAAGDELLQKISEVLEASVRSCDLAARLGGDEFGVLLFKTDVDTAKAKASALACRIAEQVIEMPTQRISVTTAWGVAPCEIDDTAKQILGRADRAMYVAKQAQAARGIDIRR
ncbi:MAG: GGDEF domain-containing protein [Maricaulaceae bacterium]